MRKIAIVSAGLLALTLSACGSIQKDVQPERVVDYSAISFGAKPLHFGIVAGVERIPVVMVDQMAVPIGIAGSVSLSVEDQGIKPRAMSFEDVERYNREVQRAQIHAITSGRFIRGGQAREIKFEKGVRYTLLDGGASHELVLKDAPETAFVVGDLIEVFQADSGDLTVQKIVRKPIGLGENTLYRHARKAATGKAPNA